MPFRVGDEFSIPSEYRQYYVLTEKCEGLRRGSIAYLTVDESLVEAGESQRRSGLHIDAAQADTKAHGWNHQYEQRYGGGRDLDGGIYMASNVAGSTILWDCWILEAEKIMGDFGELDHLRDLLGEGKHMKVSRANELLWITDETPHESAPLPERTYRQFFRVVTSVDVWYSAHNTSNPFVELPEKVKILHHNKFLEASSSAPDAM